MLVNWQLNSTAVIIMVLGIPGIDLIGQ
jgi:hypothetical protein